jgi:hypothetical protein
MTTPWMNINLLPPQPVTQRYSFSFHAIGLGLLALSTLTLSVLAWSSYQTNQNDAIVLKEISSQQLSQRSEILVLQARVNVSGAVTGEGQSIGPATDVKELLDSVAAAVPSGLSIQSIHYTPEGIDLVGSCTGFSEVADYEDKLQSQPAVTSVWLTNVSNGTNTGEFTLKMVLKGGSHS